MVSSAPTAQFDACALYAALDDRRVAHGLSWPGVARALWDLSSELNAQRGDHPISPATLTGMVRRGEISCQHALFILRWLDRSPEEFLTGASTVRAAPLPAAGRDRRLRWHLHRRGRRAQDGLFEAMDAARRRDDLAWSDLARPLHATAAQLSGVRTARFAIGMRLAMNITQWLERPAADFIYPARW
jgi:hypothetical protein